MPQTNKTRRSNVLCRYYANGGCRNGARCKFSHDRDNSSPSQICRYYLKGYCRYGDWCKYVHLTPHREQDAGKECPSSSSSTSYRPVEASSLDEEHMAEIKYEKELSFAAQHSLGKTCGICLEIVKEKEPHSERKFGILENCNHVFCFSCIKKWRKMKQLKSSSTEAESQLSVYQGCPECRVLSDFVTPSRHWIESEKEKEKLINDYKKALSSKPCKYFNEGWGECRFAGACFYLHAYRDGSKAELPLPQHWRRQNRDSDLETTESISGQNLLEQQEQDDIELIELMRRISVIQLMISMIQFNDSINH